MTEPERNTLDLYENMSFARRAGFGKRPALLVIDFQKGLTEPDMPFYGWHDDQIAHTNLISAAMREKGYPILFTTVAFTEAEIINDCYAFMWKIPSLYKIRVGSTMAEIDDRLDPQPDDFVLVKKFQSAFIGTPLSTILTGLGVDTLIVTGCATSGCVRGTVTDATALGYRVILVAEAIGDFTSDVHERNMFDMDVKNGDIVTTSTVVNYVNELPVSDRKEHIEKARKASSSLA